MNIPLQANLYQVFIIFHGLQIHHLKERRRNDMEKILSIFDQSNVTDIKYILDVDEDLFPAEYRQIIRRLRKAMEDPQKRREMELEDDVVKELQDKERQIEAKNKALEEKDQIIADNAQIIAGKDQTIADNAQIIAGKDQTIADKDQVIAKLEKEIADFKLKIR